MMISDGKQNKLGGRTTPGLHSVPQDRTRRSSVINQPLTAPFMAQKEENLVLNLSSFLGSDITKELTP